MKRKESPALSASPNLAERLEHLGLKRQETIRPILWHPRECDELLLASIETTSFGASYAAPIALLNAIVAAVGQYRLTQTLALAKEIAAVPFDSSPHIAQTRLSCRL